VGNLALMIAYLILDEWVLRLLSSDYVVREILKDRTTIEKSFRSIMWLLESFLSFKTMLYVFYISILVISQVIEFYPGLIGKGLEDFILISRYNIVLLIAFDKLTGHFAQDRKRTAEMIKDLDHAVRQEAGRSMRD
jgi:hypothetical protein